MNALTKYFVAIGILLLGVLSQISALDHAQVEDAMYAKHDDTKTQFSLLKLKVDHIHNQHNSSNSQTLIFEMEEEEDKQTLLKKQLHFYSFFLAFILSQETASSIIEDNITIQFNKTNTQTAASRCILLQVFNI
jgi:hypothetical protein